MAINNAMRTLIILIALIFTTKAYSQEIRSGSVKRIMPEDNGSYLLSGTVPATGHLLVAGSGYNGLRLLDTSNGKLKMVSGDTGSGYEPVATADGKKIIYRSDSFSENMKYSSVYSYDMVTGEKKQLVAKGRDVAVPAVSGNTVFIKSEGGIKVEQAGPVLKSDDADTFVVIEEMMPVLYRGGERKALMPNGAGFYIWVSLSPDGTKILYNYQGGRTYICDTEGKILHDLGRINAPRWFSDKLVIGMDDRDDGYRITSSELVYYSLGKKMRAMLTSTSDRSEMFPFAAGNRHIAFCTDNGEIYVMKVRVR